MPRSQPGAHVDRVSRLQWVAIANMRTSPNAQREFYEPHARAYADDFDLEALGYPVVNKREGVFYVIDGQHRIAALRMMGWEDQQVECETYFNLTEQQEAELFLRRNTRRRVTTFDEFMVAVTAGHEAENDILRIVRSLDLRVTRKSQDGCISAVGALDQIYATSGAAILTRTVRICRDAYGKDRHGLRSEVLRGMALVCSRYDGKLDDAHAVRKLALHEGGALGLLGAAKTEQRVTGKSYVQNVAVAIVKTVNAGLKGTQRLADWWRTE